MTYGFRCEYCEGTVREKRVEREPLVHPLGIVIFENVTIGECDHCHAHYHPAGIVKRAEEILTSKSPPQRTIEVLVATY